MHQTISSDVVGGEATLLPTEEWVEHEVMKSASGWIEVHKQSIVSIVLAFFQIYLWAGEIALSFGLLSTTTNRWSYPSGSF